MQSNREADLVSKFLPLALAVITIFVNTNLGSDPVNLPKLTFLVITVFLFIGIHLKGVLAILKNDRKIRIISMSISIGLLVSLIMGKSGFVTNFYGSFGRNTGTLTYLMLVIIFLLVAALPGKKISTNIIFALYLSGLINVAYGLIYVASGKDIINWSNRYGKFLSTLGNPDFASGFLGIVFAVGLHFVLDNKQRIIIRISIGLISPVIIFVIINTGALQGLILVVLSSVIYFSIWCLTNFKSRLFRVIYLIFLAFAVVIAIIGTLQKGPLSSILYKPSVSIRGAYWRAGFEMFKSSPFYGIGLDSYGDWYRRSRDLGSLLIPGIDITTDAAHNVFLDILAGGGLILFVPYIFLIGYVCNKGIIFIRRNPKDYLAQGLFVGWVCYLAQSVVSINQIGLAIWGWALAGAIIVHSKIDKEENLQKKFVKPKYKKTVKESTILISVASFCLGSMLILPVQISEAKWQRAVKEQNLSKILKESDSWPKSCAKYIRTYNLFAGSTNTQVARSLAQKCRNLNKNNFDSVLLLEYFVSTDSEKLKLKKEAHRLDPLNPKYKL